MAAKKGLNITALGNDPQPFPSGMLQGCFDDALRETAAAQLRRHPGMREDHGFAGKRVISDRQLAANLQLKSAT